MAKKKMFDTTGFRYKPIEYELFVVIYDRIKIKLTEIGYEDSVLYNNLDKTFSHIKKLLEQAEKSCCRQIRANGYFSFSKMFYRLLECIERELSIERTNRSTRELIASFNQLSDLVRKQNEFICYLLDETNLEDDEKMRELEQELTKYPDFFKNLKMFRQISIAKQTVDEQLSDTDSTSNDSINISEQPSRDIRSIDDISGNMIQWSLPLFSPHLQTICDSIYETIIQPNTKNKEIIYRDHFMYWLDSGLVSFFKFYIFVLPFLRTHLYSYPRLIFSSKFRSKIINKITTIGVTIDWPFEFWNLSDMKVSLLFVKFKTRNTNTKSREVRIPTQNSIVINESHVDRLTINDTNEIKFNSNRTIRCKYIRPRNVIIKNCEKLIVHYHGGGYFSNRCDSHEIYLRYWVSHCQIPVLTVDYKVKRAFPAGLKDCFDVYVWLRKARVDEVKSILGFFPKKIVLVGDSAGGNLAFGVALALNDLRTDYKSKFRLKIPMPNGIIPIYAPFLINSAVSPSRSLSTFDTLVPLAVQLIIMYGISGLIPGLRPNTRLEALRTYLFPFRDPRPWFDCAEHEFRDKCTYLAKIITSPYLSPLYYEKYDQLTDIPMHLITAEFDSFLDESITLAKLYRGPLKVDVLEDLCHGFLNLKFVGKRVSNATMFCCEKVAQIFEQTN